MAQRATFTFGLISGFWGVLMTQSNESSAHVALPIMVKVLNDESILLISF